MPLDFIASNLTHTKPAGTLDFISPERTIFGIEIGNDAAFTIAGPLSGQFLEARWSGKPEYGHPAHVVETTWGNKKYIGAGIDRRTNLGSVTIVQQQFIKPLGFDTVGFGAVQTKPNSKYLRPTGGKLDTTWQGKTAYIAPATVLGATWSEILTISPLPMEPTLQFGDTHVVPEQNIVPAGWVDTTFGNNYVLHWYEYAPPMWNVDASWAGADEYFNPTSGVIHALWQPKAGSQTIAPIAFVDGAIGTPRVRRQVKPAGIASTTQFGIAQLFPSICSTWTYSGPTNRIPVAFENIAEALPGNRIPVEFRCASSGIRYSDFEGFIEAREGGTLDVKMYDGYLSLNAYDGASAEFSLRTQDSLQPRAYGGEFTAADLTVYPATNFLIAATFEDGASVSLSLATTTVLALNDFVDGASATAVLDTRPPATLSLNAYDGASASLSLATGAAFQLDAYDGGEFKFDLAINPSAEIVLPIYEGGTLEFGLSVAPQLGLVGIYEGATVAVSLDTLDNWLIFDGAYAEVSFATSTTMPMDGYSGENVSAVLDTRPSEGIGTFRAYDGANVVTSFTTLPQVLLYPNEIKDGHAFNYDILGFMGIDLNNTACCPIKESPDRIELTAGPAPDERYDGDKTVFTADLSTLPRFSMQVYSGEAFTSIDPEYMSFNFYEGSNAHVDSIIYDRYNFNLCEGNFIPDGDHVNVELIATDSLCSDSTLIFDGASAKVEIENNVQFQLPVYTGENLDVVLTIADAWIFSFLHGEYVRVSNPEFVINLFEDAAVDMRFEVEDIYGFSGEYVQATLSTDYDVEFLEVGCLDNEFVPANENGDPDMDRFNPVPVELDFFSHSIKARCF